MSEPIISPVLGSLNSLGAKSGLIATVISPLFITSSSDVSSVCFEPQATIDVAIKAVSKNAIIFFIIFLTYILVECKFGFIYFVWWYFTLIFIRCQCIFMYLMIFVYLHNIAVPELCFLLNFELDLFCTGIKKIIFIELYLLWLHFPEILAIYYLNIHKFLHKNIKIMQFFLNSKIFIGINLQAQQYLTLKKPMQKHRSFDILFNIS